jgi:hypothetical protein
MKNNSRTIILLLVVSILFSLGSSGPLLAEELPGLDSTSVPANETKSVPAKEAEAYVGVFGGNARFADTSVSATYQCFFCSPVTASKNVQFSKGEVAGLRMGMWGDNEYQYIGFAFEFSTTKAHSMMSIDQVDVSYESFSLMPMVRLPLFKTDSMPGGHLNLYAGVAFSKVMSGNMSVTFPELPRTVSGDAKGSGSVFLIGASLKYSRVLLFLEERATNMNLSFSDLGDSGDANISAKQTIAGAAYRF